MPPLSAELFGMNSKDRSFKLNESLDTSNDLASQEFMNLKEAISQKPGGTFHKDPNSRNS